MSRDDKGKPSKVSLIRLCADAGKKGIDSAYDRSRFMGTMAHELLKEGAKKEALAVARDAVLEARKIEGLREKAEALYMVADYQEKAGDLYSARDTLQLSKDFLTEFAEASKAASSKKAADDAAGGWRGLGNFLFELADCRLRWSEVSALFKKARKKKRAEAAPADKKELPKPPTGKAKGQSTKEFVKIMMAHSRKTDEYRSLAAISDTLYREGCKKEARKVLYKSLRAANRDAEKSVPDLMHPVMPAVVMADQGLERESRAAFAEAVARVKRFWHEGSLMRSLTAISVRPMILAFIAKEQLGVGHADDAVETLRGVRIPPDSVKKPAPSEIVEAFMKNDKVDYALCYMRGIEDAHERARAWCKIARGYADKKDKRAARAMLGEARDALARASGDLGETYRELIKMYNNIYEFDSALETAKMVPDRQLRARILAAMADGMAKLRGDDKNANEIFALAVDSSADIEDGFMRAMHLYWIALEQAESGHTGSAWDDSAGIFATVLRLAGRKVAAPKASAGSGDSGASGDDTGKPG